MTPPENVVALAVPVEPSTDLPRLIAASGDRARLRFLEFFAGQIRRSVIADSHPVIQLNPAHRHPRPGSHPGRA